MFICHFLLFFSPPFLLNQRRQWWSWRASLTIFPPTPTFCRRFFLISSKGQRRACVCVRETQQWGGWVCIDGHFVFSFSLEEECETPLCTAALTAKNQELQNDIKKVTSIFEKLQSYIAVLALPSECARVERTLTQLNCWDTESKKTKDSVNWYDDLVSPFASQVFVRTPCHKAAPLLSLPSWPPACTVSMMPLKVSDRLEPGLSKQTLYRLKQKHSAV